MARIRGWAGLETTGGQTPFLVSHALPIAAGALVNILVTYKNQDNMVPGIIAGFLTSVVVSAVVDGKGAP